MYTKTASTSGWSLLGAAAVVCTLFAADVTAKNVTVAIHVSTQGLDLSQLADAQTFYKRLEHAAEIACTHGNRVDLVPLDVPKACFEKALGGAVRVAKAPLVTQMYLTTHTFAEAAAYGIEIPVQVAGR
jgi:UrcA family protein